jgi:hypothetical protein
VIRLGPWPTEPEARPARAPNDRPTAQEPARKLVHRGDQIPQTLTASEILLPSLISLPAAARRGPCEASRVLAEPLARKPNPFRGAIRRSRTWSYALAPPRRPDGWCASAAPAAPRRAERASREFRRAERRASAPRPSTTCQPRPRIAQQTCATNFDPDDQTILFRPARSTAASPWPVRRPPATSTTASPSPRPRWFSLRKRFERIRGAAAAAGRRSLT